MNDLKLTQVKNFFLYHADRIILTVDTNSVYGLFDLSVRYGSTDTVGVKKMQKMKIFHTSIDHYDKFSKNKQVTIDSVNYKVQTIEKRDSEGIIVLWLV